MKPPAKLLWLSAVLLSGLCSVSLQAQQLLTKKALSLDVAKKIAAVAEAEAAKNKWTMVITIVDDSGNLIYLEKMDGTQIGSIDVAIQKAKTAIRFKRPTRAFEDAVLKDGRSVIMTLPEVVAVEGGLPLVVDGVPIGAIGVSGMSSAQDGVAAKAGVDALAQL